MKRAILAVICLAGASYALADGLSKKFKNWDKSPQAYFLTNDEKAQWKNVKSDDEAQAFVEKYKAVRGPEFEKMLNDRIAAADKYFSTGKTKGSETLRGKVIIVFGPPASIDLSQAGGVPPGGVNPNNQGVAGGGRSGGVETSSAGPGALAPHSSGAEAPATFTLAYDEEHAPKAIGEAFKVELKMYSGADQQPWDEKDLNEKFDAVAKSTIQAPAAPQS